MASEGNAMLLGRLAVHKKLITMEQLVEATAEQGRFGNEHKRLGELLVEKGFLTPAQLDQLLVLQQAFLGELGAQGSGQSAPTGSFVAPTSSFPASAAPRPFPVAPAASSPSNPFAPPPPRSTGPVAATSSGSAAPAFAPPQRPPPQAPAAPLNPLPHTPPPAAYAAAPQVATAPVRVEAQPPSAPSASPAPSPPRYDTAPPPAAETAPRPPTGKVSLPQMSVGPGPAPYLEALLRQATMQGASDVHFHPSSPPKARLAGALTDMSQEKLEAGVAERLLREALNPAQAAILDETGQVDFAYAIPGLGRFRANVYRGLSGLNGVFRFVPTSVPSLPQLGLPSDLSKLPTFHQGLVLVTGPAGCGNSTTLASLLNIINEERNDHILTIEDPIEYIHPSKRCLVNQRQVNRHTESFARALRAALREDPDIIVIGELRDLETISLALTAAETGHLVLGTLHTSSAIRTINRIVGAFPPNEQAQVRSMISESLRAIISQRLLPRRDGNGRVAALEILQVNKAVSNTIRENKTFQLRSMMQTGRTQGMLLLDQSLQDLVRSGTVSKEEATRHVEDVRFLQ
ncbi:MAG: type IV pilus twitching motility protein PilT [Myxococcota bacterium]